VSRTLTLADELAPSAELVSGSALRIQRDFIQIITLVQAHALLHRASRERDPEGRIVATCRLPTGS
jgi:hypothetical protein